MTPGLRPFEERPARLLVVAAHPTDADVAMAGSVAGWVAEGTRARLVCCTSGDATGIDPTADPLALAGEREREQRATAALVGYEEVVFLHRPEGALANDLALREQLVRVAREFRPDALAGPDPRVLIHPWGRVNHVDHRAAGEATLDLVEATANAMAFPGLMHSEELTPHSIGRLLLYWSEQAVVAVDIGSTLEAKQRAIEAHAGRRDAAASGPAEVREWARRAGEPVGLAAAETFALVELA